MNDEAQKILKIRIIFTDFDGTCPVCARI